ncbi:MAG: DUF1579 family protein [Gemmataceae bacterium]
MGLGRIIVAFAALIVGVAVVLAQPPTGKDNGGSSSKKDPQSSYEPKSGPGVGQTFLLRFVGEWDVAKAFHPRGGGEPSRTSGRCKQSMIHGARFLQSEFTFGSGDEATTGLGLIGFEPATGRFTSVWTDSRQTRMSFRQGTEKFDGTQIVLHGQSLGAEPETRRSKTITRIEDQDKKIVHRQYAVNSDGTERLVMELVMTRRPATAPAK